jgi:hypothetical protein
MDFVHSSPENTAPKAEKVFVFTSPLTQEAPMSASSKGQDYNPGDIYSFHTSPTTEFSPPNTGRYAVLKILGLTDDLVCFVVLDGIFDCHPELNQTRRLRLLRQTRGSFRGDPAFLCVSRSWDNELDDFRFVGNVGVTTADLALMAGSHTYGTWLTASHDAEGEWRWKHDRAAYKAEVEKEHEALLARLTAEEARHKKRLKSLTWDRLLAEEPFQRWNRSPPFPPPEFTTLARGRIRSSILELQALGPKPRRPEVRAVLKSCVEWFNEMDERFGHVIETEEREDIHTVLEELAFMARQKKLADEIENWRNW